MAKSVRGYNSDPVADQGGPETMADPLQAMQVPTVEQIRLRAYELYLQRGSVDGYAEQDWLEAESELKQVAGFGSVIEEDGHLQVDAA